MEMEAHDQACANQQPGVWKGRYYLDLEQCGKHNTVVRCR